MEEIVHDDSNQLQGIFFYQDAEVRQVLSAFPEIIYVDSTYKLNDMRMPLYIMMVEDSLRQSEVVALCVLHSKEKHVRCFKKNNPDCNNTKVAMADKDCNGRDVLRVELRNPQSPKQR